MNPAAAQTNRVPWLSADSNKDTKNMGDAAAVIRYYCYCCAPRKKSGLASLLRGIGRLTHGTLQKLTAFPLALLSALLQKLGRQVSLKPMGTDRAEEVREDGGGFMNRFIGFVSFLCVV